MTDTPTTPGNPIDKFALLIIKIFLDPIKPLFNRSKSPPVEGTQEIEVNVSDTTSKDEDSLENKANNIKKSTKFPKLPQGIPTRKIGFAIGFMIFVLILLNLVLGLLRRGPSVFDPTPVPTIIIDSSNPSIYAEDEEVLDLEERINVLDKELSNTVFRDTTLFPPELDFNVSF